MTASQCSQKSNERALSFSGVLNDVLVSSGVEVFWGQPSVSMTKDFLDRYDAVLVGVAPITSMSSNYAYGALNIVNELKDSPKLSLFTDTSSPRQIGLSLRSFSEDPSKLDKPIFASRSGAKLVVENKDVRQKIVDSVKFLTEEFWPQTIYASLPWKSVDNVNLPTNAKESLKFVNLDSHLIDVQPYELSRTNKWAVDNYKSRWTQKTLASHSLPDAPMRWNRGMSDKNVMEQICRSIGVIISPDDRDGTYWNYRYVQALTSGTPIATYWQESGVLGQSWSVLSSKIDIMSSLDRDKLSKSQKSSYMSSILNKKESLENLKFLLRID